MPRIRKFSGKKISRFGWLRFLAVVAAAALFVAGCGSDDDAEPDATTTTAAPAPPAAPTTSAASTTTTAPTTAPPTTTSAPPPTTTSEPLGDNAPVSISAGTRHTCAAYASGSVSCWGDNENGQLGDGEFGSNLYSTVPVAVLGISDAVAVAVGWEHSCALHGTGEVSCWGDNSHGEVGSGQTDDTVPLPAKAVGIDDAVSVTAGHWHTCALRLTGGIYCWGADHDGQLGDGQIGEQIDSFTREDVDSFVPVEVLEISDATDVSANGEHTCAVHATGEVSCWGDNWRGELGNGLVGNEFDSDIPVKVSGISDAVTISSGDFHTCVVRQGGSISCWGGNNWNGELGNGQSGGATTVALPVEVVSISDAVAVAAGASNTCAVRQSGNISCWGGNLHGQLGVPPTSSLFSPVPVAIQGIDDAIALTAGSGHICALRSSGAYCWGGNFHGQLGHGLDSGISFEKVQVSGIADAIDVSAASRHTCAVRATGEVSCWGQFWKGDRGDAATGTAAPLPVKIDGISTATSVSSGPGLSCATLEGGEAYCWGFYWDNDFTENDDGDTSPVPYIWQNPSDITHTEVGGSHACALHADGTITCAGANWHGNLGSGEFGTSISWAPEEVVGIDDAVDISLGFYHTCAVHDTGEVSCWGRNDEGQLGNGEDGLGSNSPVPVKVLGITDAVAVSESISSLTCALHETGEISCWGSHYLGELGAHEDIGGIHSSVDHSSEPVKIQGITDAEAVSAGANHVCALHETGEVSCWGSNAFGELGTGSQIADARTDLPLKVPGISDATAVSAGQTHTCALLQSSEIICWGWDANAQLGDGEAFLNTDSFVPVKVSDTTT